MANTEQSAKRVLQTLKRRTVNLNRLNRIRTFIRRVRDAIAAGDAAAASLHLRAAQPEIMRGASKGVLHHRTASRRVSRLAQAVKKLALSGQNTSDQKNT